MKRINAPRKKCRLCMAPLTRCNCTRGNRKSAFVGAMGARMQPLHPHRQVVPA